MATVTKLCHDGGLGISLEGNIDIGTGLEAQPHHYINSILPNGPVGRNGLLKKGDELLEVCSTLQSHSCTVILMGFTHVSRLTVFDCTV